MAGKPQVRSGPAAASLEGMVPGGPYEVALCQSIMASWEDI